MNVALVILAALFAQLWPNPGPGRAGSVAAPSGPAYVSYAHVYDAVGSTTESTGAMNVASGDTVLLVFITPDGTCAGHTRTPSDTASNTFTHVSGFPVNGNYYNQCVDAWVVSNSIAQASNVYTVTMDVPFVSGLWAIKLNGATTAGALDLSSSNAPGVNNATSAQVPASVGVTIASPRLAISCAVTHGTTTFTAGTIGGNSSTLIGSDSVSACEYYTNPSGTLSSAFANITFSTGQAYVGGLWVIK